MTEIGRTLRPDAPTHTVIPPGQGSLPSDYLAFALLHHPQVAAAYDDWRAAVYSIAPARALPDPKLTFQADIASAVTSLMPGFMADIMSTPKREAMAREASANSEIAYRTYVSTLVETTSGLRRAWADLIAIDRSIQVRREMAVLMARLTAASQAGYETGQGMATLEAQSNSLDASRRLDTELASLIDQRTAARARFKAALGLTATDPAPSWPTAAFSTDPLPDDATLWTRIVSANPDLASMRAMVDMAEAQAGVASTAGTPDFAAGLMADLKMNPLLFRPTASMTLPIWREKITSILNSAKARKLAASERLDARRLSLAVDFAQRLAMLRESSRMVAYIDASGYPTIDRDLVSGEAAYASGMSGLDSLIRIKLMRLDLTLQRIDAEHQQDLAFSDLVQLSAGDLSAVPSLSPRADSTHSHP